MEETMLNKVEQVLPKIFNVQTVEQNTKEKSLKIKSRISKLMNHHRLYLYCEEVAGALNMDSVNIILVDWEGKYLDGAKYERGVDYEK